MYPPYQLGQKIIGTIGTSDCHCSGYLTRYGRTPITHEVAFHDEDVVPDVSLGLINSERTPDNVYLAGELKTSWTVPKAYMRLNQPNTSYHLETLIET
ncbi:hypothetical protein ACN38_g12882 [Penicillium nordicum]|uniref:Uncharacterized protein n=1 Tax=Penicillium nordicum TaxID=229535 RepID=A0A0M9W9I5_9EURO|nr:hypothetical protein ACN38_g12882 [Penicillium nordicum]